jgi:hypothetical protein
VATPLKDQFFQRPFQIAQIDLAPDGRIDLERKLDFADRSIRRHHAGPHVVTLIMNGRDSGSARFSLVDVRSQDRRP